MHAWHASAEGGEFTFRAFLHGRLDLTEAEAVPELASSQSKTARALALGRLEGSLKNQIADFKQRLLTITASVEVQMDYAEDELDEFVFPREQLETLRKDITVLADTYQVGRLYREGARIVLAGSTNAGKASVSSAAQAGRSS